VTNSWFSRRFRVQALVSPLIFLWASGAAGNDPCADCVRGILRCETGSVAGELREGDCIWVDDTFYDVWSLELTEPTHVSIRLTADFNTFLFFTDSACQTIRTNDNCNPDERDSGSCIEADVPPGSYFVLTNGFSEEDHGPYTLSIDCGPIRTCTDCLSGELECDEPIESELTNPPFDCDLGDGSPLEIWQLDLAESGRVVIEMTSEEIDPFLYLYGSDCIAFAANNSAVPQVENARVIADLDAGTYFVGANAFRREGTYRLSATCFPGFDFCTDCVAGEISCEKPIAGLLSDDDCASRDNGQPTDLYTLDVTKPGRYTFELSSKAFDPVLELLSASCDLIQSNDDCTLDDESTSCLTVDLAPGQYAAGVRSDDPRESGVYNLRTTCEVGFEYCDDCISAPISCGDTLDGVLFKGSCTTPSGGAYVDLVPLTLAADTTVLIEMTARHLDSFIWLYDESCEAITSRDDGGDGNDARLLFDLPAGSYKIGASSVSRDEVGEYELSLRCPDLTLCRECADDELSCGQDVSGELTAKDCPTTEERPSDSYTLHVDTLSTFEIVLSSEAFSPSLAIRDALCQTVRSSDGCEEGAAGACLSQLILDPGTYTVVVSSTAAGEDVGAYELSATCKPLDICAHCVAGPIECNSVREESITPGDCPFPDGTFVDAWKLEIDRVEVVLIDLESSDFDPFLFLVDEDCNQILATDSCSIGGLNRACIQRWLDPGTYYIVTKPAQEGSRGDYTLRVDCQTPTQLCENCEVSAIECNEPVRGTFPSAEGCTSPRGRPVDLYSFTLESETDVRIGLNAPFDTFLHLFDAQCEQIASNDDGGTGSNSRIETPLAAGTYFVGVSSFEVLAIGDFDLFVVCDSAWFERACAKDCVQGTVACDVPLETTYPKSECWSPTFAPVDTYRFELEVPATVRCEADATFDASLYFYDASCRQISFDDNGGVGNEPRIDIELDPGIYFVGVSAARAELAGDVTLEVTCEPVDNFCPDCVVAPIACADRRTIDFPTTECRTDSNRPLDLYSFTLSQEDELTIRLTTEDYDPSVFLFDDLCREIAFDDDGGQGTNAAMTMKLLPGRYYIGASSFGRNATGQALLEVLCRREGVCAECTIGSVAPGESKDGTLPTSGCTGTLGEHLDVWELDLDEPYVGSIRVVVAGEVFDPTLALYSGTCTVLDFNDDDLLGFNSLLDVDLEPGKYYLKVSTLFVGDGGAYQVILSGRPGVGPFVRGDFDANGDLQLTDAIGIFNFLFLGGAAPSCAAAADASAQGEVNLTSGVYILNFLFTGGSAPTAPYPECGTSETETDESLGCESPHACP